MGILEAVDMDTYRTEKQATVQIALQDEDAEIDPIQGERGGGAQAPLLDSCPSSWTSSTKPGGTPSTTPTTSPKLSRTCLTGSMR